MSDIFISYTKTDHALALRLSAFLEAEGWTVWWDNSLGAADLYRDEIMKQLAAARAVITIWSANSIKSDWVRAEAGRAKADGKLIPVKTPEVGHADIPLPFGEMHTENVGSTDLIRAAIVAQLAKPVVEPAAWASLTKGFKWELLSWWGIIGGALTLFTALSATIKLADWARVLVQHWKEWTHATWVWLFGWLGIHLPPEWTPVLSFLLFGSALTIGQAVKFRNTITFNPIADKYRGKSFRLISWQTLFSITLVPIVSLIWMIFIPQFVSFIPCYRLAYSNSIVCNSNTFIWYAVLSNSAVLGVLVLLARDRLNAAVTIFITPIFWNIIIGRPEATGSVVAALVSMMFLLPLFLLLVAPAKAVSRRLIFLALGLLLLIALNELSKLGLDVTAPQG
jgi:TIR domain